MARHIEDTLDLERENEESRSILHATKIELNRIRREYLDSGTHLSEKEMNDMDDELEILSLSIDNALL